MAQQAESIQYQVGAPMPGTKWVVRGKLGQGGMGVVLDVVKQGVLKGAMKVLHPCFAQVPEYAARFLDEVKVTAQLQHPNIVQVLDCDRLEDGTPFMVMERLRGRTLGAALRDSRTRRKSWTPANIYSIAAQVAEALSRAHSHALAIVHRDIKPENIYLHRPAGSLDAVVKVMDFGVAAVVGQRDRAHIGTPRYMAPEQLRGGRVTPQTDQYALALLVYAMLTGRLPWNFKAGDLGAIVEAHTRIPPSPPSKFCGWLPACAEGAILKALAKDPSERHESVHGLVFGLRALEEADPNPAAAMDPQTTVPWMGTLADGFATTHGEPDTVAQLSAPHAEDGEVADVPEAGEPSSYSVQFSEVPAAAGPLEQQQPAGPQLARLRLRRRGAMVVGAVAAGLGALALVAAIGGRGTKRAQSAPPMAFPLASELPHENDSPADPVQPTLEIPAPQPAASVPSADRATAASVAEPATTASARVPGERAVLTPGAAKAGGAAQGRSRMGPALKAPVPPVPDDGRDELYVPGERGAWSSGGAKAVGVAQVRPRTGPTPKRPVPDDGRDELYVPTAP
jgi:eukaryotic-like serine/threonine-protein kinase